jgi:hypothetical protein
LVGRGPMTDWPNDAATDLLASDGVGLDEVCRVCEGIAFLAVEVVGAGDAGIGDEAACGARSIAALFKRGTCC